MLNSKLYLLIIMGLFFSEAVVAEGRIVSNKDVTGVAGLIPQDDIYQLKVFDNNYVLPLYQTQSPNEAYYRPQNPNHNDISKTNLQFQISLKYGLASNLFIDNDGLYVAYSQIANWQAYDTSAYFRDVQYQPQIFWVWQHGDNDQAWQSTSIGFEHQSNGKGGIYERSWNRTYLTFLFSFDDLKISLKPWLRMELSSTDYNPDIEDYMGYGMVRADWYLADHQISLTLRNLAESGFSKGYEELSWRFPLYKGFKGYLKLQSGFGMTISDYDHFDNAIGIGFAY
ncbi:phospholipase A [Shewanella sp. D64]|uniref:phospholipase A n=1 Tax=unclassified Shewanella TaxID=196818 RepID=UPI0022BA6A20|nr:MULTISPECIES: phospholipase A [unclassified Shewanella]MEC4724372.1 phospholipase A [Shewanella sp. D64]MEC4738884.1 phospholipase A [Shewanella sp. E94]WBJ97679.1 phospholipase A [Shewanella sp. MTB7]